MERDGYGFKHGRLCEREVFGQFVDDASGNGDILGEGAGTAVVSTRNPEYLAVIAEVDLSCAAEAADSAGYGGVKGDSITHAESGYRGAKSGNRPGSLMTHDQRRNSAARGAVISMDITATDSACGYLHQYIRRAGHRNR